MTATAPSSCLGGVDGLAAAAVRWSDAGRLGVADHDGDFDPGPASLGDFVVTGTFDGTSLTPSDVVPAAEFEEPARSALRGRPLRDALPGAGAAAGGRSIRRSRPTTRCRRRWRGPSGSTATPSPGRPIDQPGLRPSGDPRRCWTQMNDPTSCWSSTSGSPTMPRPPRRSCARSGSARSACSTAQHTDKELRRIRGQQSTTFPACSSSSPGEVRVELHGHLRRGSYRPGRTRHTARARCWSTSRSGRRTRLSAPSAGSRVRLIELMQ